MNRGLSYLAFSLLIIISISCSSKEEDSLPSFPAGYIDSPYIIPDGSALYFIHSVASTYDILTGNPNAEPVAEYLPGHQGQGGEYWWNTDIYVSYRNPDGTWGEPQNLGPNINTENMESSPWVNEDETVLIFTRESVTDLSLSGSFISRRNTKGDPWGTPERLPGELGDYAGTGFHDFHETPSGNLYFWSDSSGDGELYWARRTGQDEWASAEPLADIFQTDDDETQPWVNDGETVIYFNRRGEDGNTELLYSTRGDTSEEWNSPIVVQITDFADPSGSLLWGEPSFTNDSVMFFIRFDTSTEGWDAELFSAHENTDNSFGPPEKLVFSF